MYLVFLLRQSTSQQSHHVFGPAASQMREEQEDFRTLRHKIPERKPILAHCTHFTCVLNH